MKLSPFPTLARLYAPVWACLTTQPPSLYRLKHVFKSLLNSNHHLPHSALFTHYIIMSSQSFASICTTCQATFIRPTVRESKYARDTHARTCVKIAKVAYANQTITLHRDPTTRAFTCKCSVNPSHSFISVNGLRNHVKVTGCEWIGGQDATPTSDLVSHKLYRTPQLIHVSPAHTGHGDGEQVANTTCICNLY